MANRIALIIMFLLLCLAETAAQQITQGSLEALSDIRVVTVEYDFSKAKVEDEPLIDYLQTMELTDSDEYLSKYEKEQKEVVADFIEEYNDTNCPILLSVNTHPSTVMVIFVRQISRTGNTIVCDYTFKDKLSGDILLNIAMTAKDGRVGSFFNLMGDAFEEAGKKVGKYMKKNLKRIQKV